jgi:hypothetical protein
MPVLVGWTLIVVLQVPNSPYLQGVRPPEQGLSLEQCIKKAATIMSNFETPQLALCSPIYKQVNNGDPT